MRWDSNNTPHIYLSNTCIFFFFSTSHVLSNYLKREMDDDSDIEYEACNRVFKEQHARKVAKFTIAQRIQVQVRWQISLESRGL